MAARSVPEPGDGVLVKQPPVQAQCLLESSLLGEHRREAVQGDGVVGIELQGPPHLALGRFESQSKAKVIPGQHGMCLRERTVQLLGAQNRCRPSSTNGFTAPSFSGMEM
jgi:hypothetical protein